MKKLYLITGPMGVGKTTVGKLLSNTINKTAFIDGDWCIDIHPFIGNKETKGMAINNIIHMIRNYYHCSECNQIVLSWVMSINTVNKIMLSVSDLDLEIYNISLICDKESLAKRWHNDMKTEWRINELLEQSIQSIKSYNDRETSHVIDTSNLLPEQVVELIISKSY
ncbi:AAA family ATPase [Haloplasma contractile]|uniref:AAA domain protein n=1 Tax=Haloplasma contractile SSD-17B TaxID=1033810 RepID=U2FEN5_9MOLU|nr:AAA family ATPase [Haloplasma contractile]ERJ11410.1 AAA domain protein [Haloplasma contractile SSD-17B]